MQSATFKGIDTTRIHVSSDVARKNTGFRLMKNNRDINESHVKRLRESILEENMLRQNPIIVDEHNIIVDGQHRWLAVKDEPGVEMAWVYLDRPLEEEDIIRLNTQQRNWSLTDYATHYAEKGIEAYEILLDIGESYNIPLSAVREVIGEYGNTSKGGFRNGEFKISIDNKVMNVIKLIYDLREEGYTFTAHVTFVRALRQALKHEDFSLAEFAEKVHSANVVFRKQQNKYHYLRMFEDILNYRRRKSNHIKLA